MTICLGCKHWDRAPKAPLTSVREGDLWSSVEVPGEWGTCEGILHRSGDSHGVPPYMDGSDDASTIPDTPAYLADGSGYFASLTTRSDFGCTLFENTDEVT